MKTTLSVTLIAATALLLGCTATEQGVGIGAASGAGIGAIIGHQSGETGEGAVVGAAAGALIGGLIGHQSDKEQQARERQNAYEQGRRTSRSEEPTSSGRVSAPSKGTWVEGHYEYVTKKEWVDTSTTERVWVEEQVIGNRRIEEHWEERQVPSGFWRTYEEKTWVPGHYE